MSLRSFFHEWELGQKASEYLVDTLGIEEDETRFDRRLYRGRYFYPKWRVSLSSELLESLGQGFVLQENGLRDEASESEWESLSLWEIGLGRVNLQLELIIEATTDGVTFCPHLMDTTKIKNNAPWACASHSRFLDALLRRVDVPPFVISLAEGSILVPWSAVGLEGIKTPEKMLHEFFKEFPLLEEKKKERVGILVKNSAEWIHSGRESWEQSFVTPCAQEGLVARWREAVLFRLSLMD